MLNIRTQKLGNTTILHCVGRVTFPYTDPLQSLAMHEPHTSCVIIDFADVTAIDAAGLGVLVSLQTWSKRSARALKMMNVNPKIQSLFELTHLKSSFEICSAREMLDLMCRAIREAKAERFVPTLQAVNCAEQLLSPA